MSNAIKIFLSVLFLVCLLDMPYGYYQLVRFIALLGFVLLAYDAFGKKQQIAMIVYIGLAILFQPLFKIALGREIWNLVDVVVAVLLIASIFYKQKTKS